MSLDENGPRCPPTDGFQPQGPGSGKKIDGHLAFDRVAEKIEEGLANPVLHGPSAQIARILQFPPAKLASNDPHAHRICRCCGRATTRPVCRWFLLFCHPRRCLSAKSAAYGTVWGANWIVEVVASCREEQLRMAGKFRFRHLIAHSSFPAERLRLLFRGMIMLIRRLLAFVFCLSGAWVWAADPPPCRRRQGGGIRQDQQGLDRFDCQPRGLEKRYATSTDAARKAEIHKQYNEGIEKAKAMEGESGRGGRRRLCRSPQCRSRNRGTPGGHVI